MNRLHITYRLVLGVGLLIALGLWLRWAVLDEPNETPTIAYSDTIAITDLRASGLVSSEMGKAVYTGKGACFTCHGISGKGDGPHGALFTRKPTDLTGPLQYLMASERYLVVKYGMNGDGMVTRPDLTSQEVWDTIAYLHELQGA